MKNSSKIAFHLLTTPPVRRNDPRMSVKTSIGSPAAHTYAAFRSTYPASQSFWQTKPRGRGVSSKSGNVIWPGKAMLSRAEELVPEQRKGTTMIRSQSELKSRHAVVMFFALLSGVSAVATAVLPAVTTA